MKPVIYYGNITSHVAMFPATRPISLVSDSTIVFTGFNMTGAGTSEKKLDLLFYNRVNEIGEVLSSLVYISDELALSDVTDKTYNVKKVYANSNAELAMGLTSAQTDFTYLNCKWATSKYFTSSISPLVDTQHVELAVNGIPSFKLEKYGISFDGWYTQMSVGIDTLSVGNPGTSPMKKNLLARHTFLTLGLKPAVLMVDQPASPYLDSIWNPYTQVIEDGVNNPDGSVLVQGTSLANILTTTSIDNPYIKQDIFILPTYLAAYDNAVVQFAEFPTYGNAYPVLRDKHRIIHHYASDNNFVEAQYILQSTEYFRAVINA